MQNYRIISKLIGAKQKGGWRRTWRTEGTGVRLGSRVFKHLQSITGFFGNTLADCRKYLSEQIQLKPRVRQNEKHSAFRPGNDSTPSGQLTCGLIKSRAFKISTLKWRSARSAKVPGQWLRGAKATRQHRKDRHVPCVLLLHTFINHA